MPARLRVLLFGGPITASLLALLAAPAVEAAVTEARSTAYVYDTKGQVIRAIAEPQDGTLCLVNVYGYDGHGHGHGNRTSTSTSTQPRNCDGATAIPGVGTEAAKPTGSAVFTTGTVQVRYDYPGLSSATERKVTTPMPWATKAWRCRTRPSARR